MDVPRNHDGEVLLRKIEEVQNILRCSRSKVYELGAAGRLELVKLDRATRITDSSIRRLVNELVEESRASK